MSKNTHNKKPTKVKPEEISEDKPWIGKKPNGFYDNKNQGIRGDQAKTHPYITGIRNFPRGK